MRIYDDSWIVDRRRTTVIPQHGSAAVITEGKQLFFAPSLLFQSTIGNIPKELEGESFLFTDSFANIGMTVKKSGWMLIVVEQEPDVPTPDDVSFYLNHQLGGIFKKVADFDEGELIPGWQTPLSLLGAYVKDGTDFQSAIIRGALSVVITDIDESYIPVKQTQMVEENLRLSYLPCKYITGERLRADMEYYRSYNRGYQACPTITCTRNGTLYAAMMADPYGKTFVGGENYYGFIPVLRSRDGIAWDDPITVFDPDKDGPMRVYEPVLWADGDRLYLAYSQQVGYESNYAGTIATWITYCDDPEADAPVWSEPRMMFEGMVDCAPIKCSDGKWYCVGYFSRHFMREYYTEECLARGTGPRLYRSDDLENWDYICTVEGGERSTCEPMLTEHGRGDILLIERNDLGSRYNCSNVKDPTKWEGFKLLRYDNRDEESAVMQSVYSRNHIYRLSSGNLLLTFHDNDIKIRNNLSVALSTDGGVTWRYKLLLDERLHSSYAYITEQPNGDIVIIYDQGRGRSIRPGASEILLARLREEDIIAGVPITAKAVLKRLVSRYEECPREDCLSEQIAAAERVIAARPEASEEINAAIERVKAEFTLENYIALCTTCDSFIN